MRTIHKAAVAVLLSLLIAAPATASAASRAQGSNHGRSFVGTVRGTHAFAAVVRLTSKAGYVLRFTVGSRQVTGTVRLPGQAGALHRFVARPVTKPAGLYARRSR
jgi:hypothetical protein